MNYHKFGKTCFTTSVLVFTCTLIGNGFAFLQEEQYLIANKTLWIQTKYSSGSIPLPDMCSDTSNNTFEHPLQSCISYVESVSYGEVVGVYLREMFDLCQTCIRNSLTNIEASPETWQIGCDNIPTTSDIVLFSYVFSIDGLVENLESGTWIGDVCRHDNVSHIKLKDLEGCDHSSNAANILFVQHVCSIKNSTNSKDFGLALPTSLNSSHLPFEKLLKAYNCAQECDAYQFFHVTFTEQDLKCKCERGNAEPSIQIDKETGQHIYEINADPDLQGDTLNTLGEDLCVVANLKMEIRPITFTVHTTYCNESIATLCQKVTDKKINYIFSDNETNFMESWNYCKKESAYLFLPEDFQSGALEKILTFSQFIAEKISVWSGVIERKTWNPLSCKMNIFSSNCSILTSSATGTDMHYLGSQTTHTTESTVLHTTTEETLEDKNKKNWFDSSSDCCRKSKILYDEEIQNDDDNFNIIHEMNAQNFTEIYLNKRVFKGPWIVPAGTYTIYNPNDSLSEVTDIYDCAVLCRKCWYFGMMNNSCFNISSLFHHAAESSNKHTIDLYFSKSGDILETTAPSVGVNCVQVSTNTHVFPVSYILYVKDCEESLQPLCLRANDSFYFTSQTPLNFTDSNIFCKDKGATLASSISSRHLYNSKIANGTYWTAITRKNQLGRKDCQNETDHGGYCRKMFSNSSIVTTDCEEKTYSICIKEKEETTTTEAITTTATTNFTTNITTNTTTTSTSTRTTTPHTITSPDLTTASTESHVIHVDYIVKVIQDHNCIEAAFQCQQNYGSVWSYDLPDMEDTNVSQILQNKGLEETCTNYGLFVSNWIMQTGYSGGLQSNAFNIAINPEAAYECSNQCVEFPNFKSLENECHCLLDQTNVSDYSENTTAVVYSTIKDVDIEAMELENEGKQCVVASIDFDVFPMSYTFKGTACNETHHVICQKFHDHVLRYIFLPNATYYEAADRCSNLSAKIFNPREYDPGLLSKVLKSVKTETIWTEIFREFIWRKINGTREHLKKFEPLFCRVLGCNGTLESQLCSERNSALCFINKEYENFTQMPTTSTISQVGTTVHTTAELTPEEMNKKNWFDWSNDCCQKSNTLYDNEIQNDKNDFDIIEEMNAQNFTEIYLNYRVFPGAWIVPAGTYTIKFQNVSLSKVTDIYDCAILCRKCWYFGMMNNSCVNISSLFYNGADSSDNHTIDLYSSREGDILEATVPSVGVDCVQVVINRDVFPISYLLSVKDCEESIKALCLRANDSFYFTSQTPLNFTDSKTFCKDKGAILASYFFNLHLYNSRIGYGTYWTAITRKNQLRRKDCQDQAYDGGYCRKMFLNRTIITTDCTEKTDSVCIKEKVTTTTSTTTTTTTTAPTTTTSLALTTASTESHVIHVDYIIKVIHDQNYSDAAVQCQQSHGSLWSFDLSDMEATNVSQMLINKGLEETWTNYELVVSNWIMQTGYGSRVLKYFLNLMRNPDVAYECSNRCADSPNFISLKNECHCLQDQKNVSDYSENRTVAVYSTIKDIEIDAEDLEYADKQCVVASINFEMFPMSYTFIGRTCNETHHVICQNVRDNAIGYTYLTNATYHEALEACSNLSATIFNPRDYNPALLSKVLKSRKTETIWTPIWREFIWQKLNDFQEYLEKFKRPLCRVLDCNGTLKTRSCSERSSALCFINKDSEHVTQIPIFSSTFSDKNNEKVTQIPNNATISQVDTSTDRRNVTTAPTISNKENLLLYIGSACGAVVLVLVVVISIILCHKRHNGINGSLLQVNVAVADDVQSNINGTILKRMNDGVLRAEDQSEGDVLQMNGFNSGFYNSRYAEYNPENQRAIDTRRNNVEISPNTFTYGWQEGDDHGDRDEDDLDKIMFNDGDYNSERDVYSVVKKDRRTTDTDEDGGDRENSDNHPEFKFTMRYNKNTFDRRKVEERGGLSEL
ncbi:uncharacterized protein LOC128192314 isoform X2 [Crassostrea angulata]|uniref:uncharacterized protein LOC128192314 isoform X2 n=1 Tax=Magallana angulata TaxID=2784310 RepID=UPI0022B09BA0|nr:uncharacterized protein LOC128192314 isoform X2 [Crassostrea angulata]